MVQGEIKEYKELTYWLVIYGYKQDDNCLYKPKFCEVLIDKKLKC